MGNKENANKKSIIKTIWIVAFFFNNSGFDRKIFRAKVTCI